MRYMTITEPEAGPAEGGVSLDAVMENTRLCARVAGLVAENARLVAADAARDAEIAALRERDVWQAQGSSGYSDAPILAWPLAPGVEQRSGMRAGCVVRFLGQHT